MYLRTTKRRNADGTEVRYHQLADNVWDVEKGCAVAKVVYNFGRAEKADEEKLRRLAASILRVVGDPASLAAGVPVESPAGGAAGDLQLRQSWPYGGVYLLQQLWSELGIDRILREHAKTKRTADAFERALFAMVANRALAPYSKLYCWEQWLAAEVFLPGGRDLDLHHLYFAMDFLEDHKLEVEKAVYFTMADLLNADVDVIFYDTTSLHFEIDEEDEIAQPHRGREYEPLRQRGHSKNGRGDAPQIVVGLAVTRDGLPVRSWVFSGETGDVTTVAKVKEDLQGWRLGRCVFVGDAGMNSEDNRKKLALGNGKYILAARLRAGDEVTTDVLTRAGRYHAVRDNLRVKEVLVGDGARQQRYVVCHNPAEQQRQAAHRNKLVAELEAELATIEQREGKAHSKRACELRTSARYGRLLRETKTGKLVIDRGAIADAARYDGKWVITSNDDTLTAEDLALGYKQLLRVEQCWRQLKSGLRMRPVFHHRPWRIQAHVTISVLALLLERIAEIRAGDTWRNLRAELEHVKVVEYDRAAARVQQTTELRPQTAALLERLRLQPPPKIHSAMPIPPPAEAAPPSNTTDPADPAASA
jgi:transposase